MARILIQTFINQVREGLRVDACFRSCSFSRPIGRTSNTVGEELDAVCGMLDRFFVDREEGRKGEFVIDFIGGESDDLHGCFVSLMHICLNRGEGERGRERE